MPSTNSHHHRSSTTRPSRRTHTIDGLVSQSRSTSVPSRQFIIILTNNPDLLRQTLSFQPQTGQSTQTATTSTSNHASNNTTTNNQNREQILNNLLRIELREVAHDYLTRTRRSFPIHYVFNMSDIEL